MAVKPLCSPTQGSATRIPPKGIHQGRGPVSCLHYQRTSQSRIVEDLQRDSNHLQILEGLEVARLG